MLIPYYGRVLGPASYGTVLAAMSLMALVWMVVNYGFSTTGSRELASTLGDAEHALVFSRQISARLILIPVGVGIGVLGTWLSPTLRSNPWFGAVSYTHLDVYKRQPPIRTTPLNALIRADTPESGE